MPLARVVQEQLLVDMLRENIDREAGRGANQPGPSKAAPVVFK